MKARDMMQADVVTATPDMSLAQGQRLMHDKGIRHLPVVSDAHLVGIVTDRDIRDAAPSPATTLTKGEINYQMDTTPMRSCMTRQVLTVPPDDDTAQVARMLVDRKIGCIPVVEGQRLVGMITEIDCLQAFVATTASQHGSDQTIGLKSESGTHVKDYMHTNVITVIPENLVSAVFQQMRGCRVRHIPVVTEWKQLVGLVTDRDIRQAGASDAPHLAQYDMGHLLRKMTAKSIMTSQVYTVTGDTTMTAAGQLLLDHKIGCLPVVHDDDKLDGIITVTDLLRAYVKQHETVSEVS